MPVGASARRLLLAFLLLLVSLPMGARARSTGAPALSVVAGTQPVSVRLGLAARLRPLAAHRRVSFAIALTSRDPAGIDRMLRAVYDPRSPLFHHFLTPAAFDARFGPDPASVRALRAWLRARGLAPGAWDGGLILPVSGDVAHIGAAFHTSMSLYRLAGGTRFAPDSSPLLPSALARSVATMIGLSEIGSPRSPARVRTIPRPLAPRGGRMTGAARASRRAENGPGGGYTPDEITSAYDFTPIYTAGYHGEQMRVALVELAPYQPNDIAAYAAQYDIAPPVINDIPVPPGNAGEQPQVEATLDIEQLLAAVPGATIDVYEAPNDDTGVGQVAAYAQVARAGNVDVLSLEWVNCEPAAAATPGFIDTQHSLFQRLALQGTTVVSATGDEGAYGCGDQVQQYSTQPAVNLPASDPYVLAVGASDLTLSASQGASTIASEIAWSCPARQSQDCAAQGPKGAGSGGGLSAIFHRGDQYGTDLRWQTGPGVSNSLSTGGRQVPDVVISGAFGTSPQHEYSIYWRGGWKVGGGTSAAAPMWAALILLTDQYLEAQGLPRLGWVNPLVYQLGATVPIYPPFHDITRGNNLLYAAGPGWDYASGWGSPDAWNFLRDVVAFEQPAQAPVTATASATPSASPTITPASVPIFAPTATITPTPSPARTLGPPPFPTVIFPSPTAAPRSQPTRTATPGHRPTPTRTPTPPPVPLCAGNGITNGTFQTGTLACWGIGGAPLPRIVPSTHVRHRFSVELRSAPHGASGSLLDQTFTLPAGLAHPWLHIGFWLSRQASARGAPPVPPLALVRDPHGRVVLQRSLVPHRDRAWSGFAAALPAQERRLTLSIQVPPQPPGASELLQIDDVHVSS